MDMAGITGLNQTGLNLLGFNTSTTATAAATTATAAVSASDLYTSSDQSIFISEYEKLSTSEQRAVQGYLNEVAAASAEGKDASSIKTETPDFITRMINLGIGGDNSSYANGYYGRTQAVSEDTNEEAAEDEHSGTEEETGTDDRGAQVVEEEDSTALVTDQVATISDKGTVQVLIGQSEDSTDAAQNAPAELRELAQKIGKNLASVLEKYLDAGCSEEVAYAQATSELRAQNHDSEDSEENEG